MSEKFSEDYLDGYEAGLAFMLRGEREHQRLAAFGAIRRAAAEARMCDKHKQYTAALAVRDAIRTAIRSERA